MSQGSLADRLGRYVNLVDSEREALAALGESERAVSRGAMLRPEQAAARELYIVRSGWLYSSLLMADGRRQVFSLHLPGEFAGSAALAFERAPFALVAVTDAVVAVIDKLAIRSLFEHQPRLAMLLAMLGQAERVALYDRLASIGRTSAKARVAALICDILHRLRGAGESVKDGVPMPLTQEEIGDATGLTAVHVNRMMRRLADEGLIARTNGRIRILDEAGLAAIAHHVDRFTAVDTSWLPPPRK